MELVRNLELGVCVCVDRGAQGGEDHQMSQIITRKENQYFFFKWSFPERGLSCVEETLTPFFFPHFEEDKVSRGSENVGPEFKM